MQLFFDFFPVLAFFVAYKMYDIYVATIVIIIAAPIQIGIHWIRTRSVNRMHVISGVLLLVFGGITLLLRDQIYIQWKPTVLNWAFGAVFLGSQFIGSKPIVQRLLEKNIELDPGYWQRLNLMWVGFFAVMGALNLYVVYNYDENTWVNFKLFGLFGLTLVFALLQGLWLANKVREQPASTDGES